MVYYDSIGHLVADSLEELHRFAASIGLKRCWFQASHYLHYDLTTANKRRVAKAAGAQHVEARVILHVIYAAKLYGRRRGPKYISMWARAAARRAYQRWAWAQLEG